MRFSIGSGFAIETEQLGSDADDGDGESSTNGDPQTPGSLAAGYSGANAGGASSNSVSNADLAQIAGGARTDAASASGEESEPPVTEGPSPRPAVQRGGPNDLPDQLEGRWLISVVCGGGHAWIRFQNLDTGEVHTAGRYKHGWGGRYDDEGNVIVPPTAVSGVQWDRDLLRDECYKSGKCVSRSVVVENPKIYKGDSPFGYNWWTNNCTTYARDAWYFYSREWMYMPGPDFVFHLEDWIEQQNNPFTVPPYRPWY